MATVSGACGAPIISNAVTLKYNLTVQGFNTTKVYGSANPIFTGTVLGVVNNDVITPSFSTSATSLSGVGVYQITATASGANINNYALIINNSTLTITPLAFLSTAASPIVFNSTVYDGSPKIPSVVGLPSTSGVNYTYNGSPTAPTNAGSYTVVGAITDPNYTGTVTSVIVISPSDLSNQISVAGLSNSMYDGSPKPTSITGLPLGVASTITYNGSTTAPTNAGSYTVVGIVNGANYVGTTTSVMVISPSNISNQLSVAGLSNSVYDGSPKPTSITGLPLGVASSVTYNGSTTAPTNTGTYTVVGIVNDANYVGTTTSVMVISPVSATITAFNATKVYGEANPVFTGSIAGIVNGDMISGLYSSVATQTSNVGAYPITATATGVNINNYQFSILHSQLSISAANATITAFNATKVYGEANPVFTGSIAGILNSDNISALFSSVATQTSNVGVYPITATAIGANINNYQFSIINSQLSITTAPSSASVSGILSAGNVANATSPTSITISGTGFVQGAMVTINGVVLTNVTVVNGNTIIATLPAGATTSNNVNISVQNPNQTPSISSSVLVKDITLSTNLPAYQSTNFSIYPNPTYNGEFIVENSDWRNGSSLTSEVGIMMIYNAQGALVYSQKIVSSQTFIKTNLASGIYFVKLGRQSVKLRIE
ncbi:MAG: T9SS C-terminal target domain-containing protein [Bacteroidetes bacterium]|nr:MAG: T9SS C-terminal target domain-containing protein [Bacteroidota bacterium]